MFFCFYCESVESPGPGSRKSQYVLCLFQEFSSTNGGNIKNERFKQVFYYLKIFVYFHIADIMKFT